MRKIILDLAVTLDGFIEGPKGEIDWCIMEDGMGFENFLDNIDVIFYGRVSYNMWGNYKPGHNATDIERMIWTKVHSKVKYVFSGQTRNDPNAIFINSDIEEKIKEIKSLNGKDIWLYGGAKLITSFINRNLIDTFRLAVHPTILGSGKPLFENLQNRINLSLIGTKKFKSGVIQLVYEQSEGTTIR